MRPPVPSSPGALQVANAIFPHVCGRCNLRLRNVRTTPSYAVSQSCPSSPCALCFDVLHDATLASVCRELCKRLGSIRHDHRFKVTTALPVSAAVIRDRAARLSLPSKLPYHVSLREAFKWALCPLVEQQLGMRYCPDAPLFLDVVFRHPESDPEAAFAVDQSNKRSRLNTPSTTAVTKAMDAMSDDQFMREGGHRLVPPPPVHTSVETVVSVSAAPVLFAGSYTKLSRIVSQTPWFIDAPKGINAALGTEKDDHGRSKRTALSVEDVAVAGINCVLNPEKVTFTAGGREDVDVRMLGDGRPFVVEVLNPTVVQPLITNEMVRRMAVASEEKSRSVEIHGLRVVERSYFSRMKAVEGEKRKRYRCVVWTAEHVNEEHLKMLEVDGGFVLQQKTPLRVLHRRTQAVREKAIFQAKVVRVVTPRVFVLDVLAAAGTYIKEFVHGDNGRTQPNVAAILGCEADILQLDVVNIHR